MSVSMEIALNARLRENRRKCDRSRTGRARISPACGNDVVFVCENREIRRCERHVIRLKMKIAEFEYFLLRSTSDFGAIQFLRSERHLQCAIKQPGARRPFRRRRWLEKYLHTAHDSRARCYQVFRVIVCRQPRPRHAGVLFPVGFLRCLQFWYACVFRFKSTLYIQNIPFRMRDRCVYGVYIRRHNGFH